MKTASRLAFIIGGFFIFQALSIVDGDQDAAAANKANTALWYVESRDGDCFNFQSPAETIEAVRENTQGAEEPRTKEIRNAQGALTAVVVTINDGPLQTRSITFYRTLEECKRRVAESKRIPDGYR